MERIESLPPGTSIYYYGKKKIDYLKISLPVSGRRRTNGVSSSGHSFREFYKRNRLQFTALELINGMIIPLFYKQHAPCVRKSLSLHRHYLKSIYIYMQNLWDRSR